MRSFIVPSSYFLRSRFVELFVSIARRTHQKAPLVFLADSHELPEQGFVVGA